jgi:hypothetical protein
MLGVPVLALFPRVVLPAATALVLPRSVRNRLRNLPGLCLPSEKTIRHTRALLEVAEGTAVRSFALGNAVGAFVCDPVRLLANLKQSGTQKLLVVGGDKGGAPRGELKGGFTKLGVTYLNGDGNCSFQPLVAFEGEDSYDSLSRLVAPVLPFTGDSSNLPSIFSFFQQLIDGGAFLNGDWPFLAAVLALKGASANYPCVICLQFKGTFAEIAELRKGHECHGSLRGPALLRIDASRIVPLPLHLLLGIGNRIIDKMCIPWCSERTVSDVYASLNIKVRHSPGKGGLSDLHGLSGPELTHLIKKEAIEELIRRAPGLTADQISSLRIAAAWLKALHDPLLSAKKEWDAEAVTIFKTLVDGIVSDWKNVTGDHLFPKMHMLLHAAQFAGKHHMLGRVAESAMESGHSTLNVLYDNSHKNMAAHPDTRLSRSLSDQVYRTAHHFPRKGTLGQPPAPAQPTRGRTIDAR